jgi:O-antigen ligase
MADTHRRSRSTRWFCHEQLLAVLGFGPAQPEYRAHFAPAAALALAFALLPVCLLLPIDADRTLPLLLVPGVALGWNISRPAAPVIVALIAWALAAILVATAFADHFARALVMASAVFWVIAGGLTARNLAPCHAAVRLVLGGIALGAVLGAVLVTAGCGLAYMDFPVYWGPRIFGMHQFAGTMAALALLRFSRVRSWLCPLFAILALTLLTGLGTSNSRAGLVGLAMALGFWFWRGNTTDRKFLLTWVGPLTTLALIIAYFIGQPFAGMGLGSAVERTATATSLEAITSARSYFWSVVWDQAINSPWIGHGADAYQYIQPRLHGAQPHNVFLQWLYEYGLAGALPLTLLLLAAITGGFRQRTLAGEESRLLQVWASSAVAGAVGFGLFDGAFYHMVIFMPVAVFVGLALGTDTELTIPVVRAHKILRPALLIALVFLMLHSWLGLLLLRAHKVEPDSPTARLLRVFPSTTHGLSLWIKSWEKTHPEVVMNWITWAQTASNQQPEFHLAALQIHFNHRDFIAAEKELLALRRKVSVVELPDVERLLIEITPKARAQTTAPPSTASGLNAP